MLLPNVKAEPRAVRHEPFSSTDRAGASARGLAEIAARSRALALTAGWALSSCLVGSQIKTRRPMAHQRFLLKRPM
jgi:hypothetical protein